MSTEVKAPEKPVYTEESLAAKIAKGEALSPEESEWLKGNPENRPDETPAEETPAKKESVDAPPAAKKPGEKPAEETPAPAEKPVPADRRAAIEAELAKPANQRDLTTFSESEIGLFNDLRRQRQRNARLQQENDVLRFKQLKTEIVEELKPEKPEEEDPLAGREDTDIITAGELRKILQGQTKRAPKPSEADRAKEKVGKPLITPEETRAQEILADAKLREKGLNDFAEVTAFTHLALYDDPEAQQIIREAAIEKRNVAEEIYWLIKGSPRWPLIKDIIATEKGRKGGKAPEKTAAPPAKEIPAENIDRGRRIEENARKVVTTGAGGSGEGKVGEFTREDVASMSVAEFGALPRETRNKILMEFGSEPNMNV